MNRIILEGELGEKFGHSYDMDALTVRESLHGLCVQIPGLEQAIREGSFRISQVRKDMELFLDEDTIDLGLSNGMFRIVPAVQGSKGIGKILLGIVLVGLSFIPGFAPLGFTALAGTAVNTVGLLGAALIFGGVASMIAPSPNGAASTATGPGSTRFSQDVNTVVEGVPVPLVYGRVLAGSVVINSDIQADSVYVPAGQTYNSSQVWTSLFGSWPNADVNLT